MGQQEVYEYEALRVNSGRRLYHQLTSFSQILQSNLRKTLNTTKISEQSIVVKVRIHPLIGQKYLFGRVFTKIWPEIPWNSGLFSYLAPSVSYLSVLRIINKSSELEPICDSLQAGDVFFDVVHFVNLRGVMAQEVGYLAERECHQSSIRLADAIYQGWTECMPKTVEPFLFNPCGFQNSVIPFAEIDQLVVATLLAAHKGLIWPKKLC